MLTFRVPAVQGRSWAVRARQERRQQKGAKIEWRFKRMMHASSSRDCTLHYRSNGLLEAVREESSTGKSPQHQAAHHCVDHRLTTLAQPFVVLAHPSALS